DASAQPSSLLEKKAGPAMDSEMRKMGAAAKEFIDIPKKIRQQERIEEETVEAEEQMPEREAIPAGWTWHGAQG
ncbi:MAG: hypothetical protein ABGY75_09380, partial [Gemmataceae bacterium]